MVSRYLVDWIQVGGLVLGLFGFFYLSLGFFGPKGFVAVRALLPAIATGLLIGFVVKFLFQGTFLSIIVGTGVGVYTYAMSVYFGGTIIKPSTMFSAILRAVLLTTLLALVLEVTLALQNVLRGESLLTAVTGALSLLPIVGTMAGAGVAAVIGAILPMLVTRERLQVIGFYVSGIAILTQFVPSVLDLLGVQVR